MKKRITLAELPENELEDVNGGGSPELISGGCTPEDKPQDSGDLPWSLNGEPSWNSVVPGTEDPGAYDIEWK